MDTIEALRLFVIIPSSGSRPHGQFIAIRIDKVETSATRESEHITADGRPCGFEPELGTFKVIRVQDDQRSTRAHRFTGREAASQAVVAEFGVGRAVIDEFPAEYASIEGFASGDVVDIELDIVDLTVFSANAHRCFLGWLGDKQA